MGLQEEWDKAENTEENIRIEETLFTDDLTRLYRFDSRCCPNRIIEIYESSDILKVRYIEEELDLGTVDISGLGEEENGCETQ